MPDQWSISLIKRFTYRGDNQEEFANKYHLDGDMPVDADEWGNLAEAIWATEKEIFRGDVHLVTAYGYQASVAHSVAQIDFTIGGGAGLAGDLNVNSESTPMAGDQCGYLRAYAGQLNGRKTYVKKYFHGGYLDMSQLDQVSGPMETAMNVHGTAMLAGGLPGGAVWVQEQGRGVSQPLADNWVHVRQLKRRGKRPTSP